MLIPRVGCELENFHSLLLISMLVNALFHVDVYLFTSALPTFFTLIYIMLIFLVYTIYIHLQ